MFIVWVIGNLYSGECKRMGAGTFLYLLWSNLSGNHSDPEGRKLVHTRGLLQHN